MAATGAYTRRFVLWHVVYLFIGIHGQGIAVESQVPSWDAAGLGLMPRQAITCLQTNDDLSRIVVGTSASLDDPNVIEFDGEGRIIRQSRIGVRFIDQISLVNERSIHAIATIDVNATVAGGPGLHWIGGDSSALLPLKYPGRRGFPFFQYGDHTNHLGIFLRPTKQGNVCVADGTVSWLAEHTSRFRIHLRSQNDAMDVQAEGSYVAIGYCAGGLTSESVDNLVVVKEGHDRPVWGRATNKSVPPINSLPEGKYGAPLASYGRLNATPILQRDVKCWAPLAVALQVDHASDRLLRVASADYQGWERWVQPNARGPYGRGDWGFEEAFERGGLERDSVRFDPVFPTISVYDANHNLLRRFDETSILEHFWCRIDFVDGGEKLLVCPRSWSARGLAGQTILPTDENARAIYRLDIASGAVERLEFPDSICDIAIADERHVAISCWNGCVYQFLVNEWPKQLPIPIFVGNPALVKLESNGNRCVIAETNGILRIIDRSRLERWRLDLNQATENRNTEALANARLTKEFPGIWLGPKRYESDAGHQRVIEAPDGLVMIDPRAGHAFDLQWAAIKNSGLDPMSVRYVMATHEHGDHAPGAYLWRVATGAKFISSPEMAYSLRQRMPVATGYGFHPPIPTDVEIEHDQTLPLAGLEVKAIRVPGHTFGSMAWMFELHGKRYASTGDLIMPQGPLGYPGSLAFSARDVLNSLRKLDRLKPDIILPGHGIANDSDVYIGAGIRVGEATGWGRSEVERSDPYFMVNQARYRVCDWNTGAETAAMADLNGDRKLDIVTLVPAQNDQPLAHIRYYLGRSDGNTNNESVTSVTIPNVALADRLFSLDINKDQRTDLLVTDKRGSATLLIFDPTTLDEPMPHHVAPFDTNSIGLKHLQHAIAFDANRDGKRDLVFVDEMGRLAVALQESSFEFALPFQIVATPSVTFSGTQAKPVNISTQDDETNVRRLRVFEVDVDSDGNPELMTSIGQCFTVDKHRQLIHQPEWSLPHLRSFVGEEKETEPEKGQAWYSATFADFNGDSRIDAAMADSYFENVHLFINQGDPKQPWPEKANYTFALKMKYAPRPIPRTPFVRVGLTSIDWNSDGINDLLITIGETTTAVIRYGATTPNSLAREEIIAMDCFIHDPWVMGWADFNNDRVQDLAVFGRNLGTGSGSTSLHGPTAVFIRHGDGQP